MKDFEVRYEDENSMTRTEVPVELGSDQTVNSVQTRTRMAQGVFSCSIRHPCCSRTLTLRPYQKRGSHLREFGYLADPTQLNRL